jgi:two-component system cell cycle sensor histidine kinase/response regulator CckA
MSISGRPLSNIPNSFLEKNLLPLKRLSVIALVCGSIYWLVEAIFHIHLFHTSFSSLILFRTDREIWLRSLFFALVCAGGHYIIHLLNSLRETSNILQGKEQQNSMLIEHSPIGIMIISEATIQFINPLGAEMLGASGPEQISSEPLTRFLNSQHYSVVNNWLNRSTLTGRSSVLRRELKMIRMDGMEINVEAIAFPFVKNGTPSFYIIFHSRSATGYQESDILKRHRLDSLGTVVSGIAHDFNNILSAIAGNISLVRSRGENNTNVHEILNDLEKATNRAKQMVKQLSSFSKFGTSNDKIYPLSIPEIIKDASDLVLHGSKISCKYNFSDDLWRVKANQTYLTQIVNNVVINSREAMPAGGELEIEAENITIRDGEIAGLVSGNYVKISFKDSGIGIPGKNLDRIFDNNFTTKKNSSGRGLTIVKQLLLSAGGEITIESKPFFGTTVSIYLPADKPAVRRPTASKAKFDVKKPVKVLVMDDNDLVRNALGRLLINFGCAVEYTENGDEAVELYRNTYHSGSPFDIAIFDLTVAGGAGAKESMNQLLTFDPQAKVIVSTGYTNHPVIKNYR